MMRVRLSLASCTLSTIARTIARSRTSSRAPGDINGLCFSRLPQHAYLAMKTAGVGREVSSFLQHLHQTSRCRSQNRLKTNFCFCRDCDEAVVARLQAVPCWCVWHRGSLADRCRSLQFPSDFQQSHTMLSRYLSTTRSFLLSSTAAATGFARMGR